MEFSQELLSIMILHILLLDLVRYGSSIGSRRQSDSYDDLYTENLGFSLTTSNDTVTLCNWNSLKGRCIKIENMNQSRCTNLGYFHQPHPTVNFNNIAKSINVQGNCVHLYDEAGCSGTVLKITPQSPSVCGFHLSVCYEGKASSLRLCNATFPPKYDNPTGIRGQTCLNDCEVKTSAHFWCKVSEDSWDFCFPRPEQHFLGMDCEGNCSLPAKMNTTNPVLYELPKFTGEWIELELLDETTCVNLPQLNFQVIASSIAVKGNCIKLYKGIGCTGETLYLSQRLNTKGAECHDDLAACNFDDVAYSVSYCNASFTELDVARTGSAGQCKTPCTTNVTYFWCDSVNGSRIFCVPRDGIDYLGNSCEGSACDLPEYNEDDWFPVLYNKVGYWGADFKMGGPNEKRCYNLQFWNEPYGNVHRTESIDLKGNCAVVYRDIGCTGEAFTLREADCASDMKNCSPGTKLLSVTYCHTLLNAIYGIPVGSRGGLCRTYCGTRGKNYFWCEVSKDAWDFCSPRGGTDIFGVDCSDKLSCAHNDRPYMVTLYDNKDYQGNQQNITHTNGSFCYGTSFKNIGSLNLNGNCVRLYETTNCTGERDELVPTWLESCNLNIQKCTNHSSWLSMGFCTVDHTLDCKECENVDEGQEKFVAIFDQIEFFGNHLRVDFKDDNICHNLKHDSTTGVNYYKNVQSIQFHGIKCIRIYAAIGCSGLDVTLKVDQPLCFENLDICRWSGTEKNVTSLSLCDIEEFDQVSHGTTLNGADCNACFQRNSNTLFDYFFCEIGDFWHYCNPKARNHIGETCMNDYDNCVFTKPRNVAHIYDRGRYAGASVTLDIGENIPCYSIENNDTRFPENFKIKSIDVTQTCIVVYDALACTGRSKVISPATTEKCKRDLPSCTNTILSLRFCYVYNPPLFHITIGSSGLLCADSCETRGKHFFGCHLQDKSYNTCLPRSEYDSIDRISYET